VGQEGGVTFPAGPHPPPDNRGRLKQGVAAPPAPAYLPVAGRMNTPAHDRQQSPTDAGPAARLAADAVRPAARSARPLALDIEIEDIAHGLARVARWNGQTRGPNIFSVAPAFAAGRSAGAHSGARLDRRSRLVVLLHDAPEYVIGDMISPFKGVIGDAYKIVERRLLAAIHRRFGLPVSSRRNWTR